MGLSVSDSVYSCVGCPGFAEFIGFMELAGFIRHKGFVRFIRGLVEFLRVIGSRVRSEVIGATPPWRHQTTSRTTPFTVPSYSRVWACISPEKPHKPCTP